MWEEGEELAIMVGVTSLDDYWQMQPVRFEKYVKAYIKRKETEAKETDVSNFNLGKYIAIAVHQPKKYPRKPFLYKEEVKKNMSVEEMEEAMRINTLRLGGKII